MGEDYRVSIDAIRILNDRPLPVATISPEKLLEQKNKQRLVINAQVAEYLEKGGTIEVIPQGFRRWPAQIWPSGASNKAPH